MRVRKSLLLGIACALFGCSTFAAGSVSYAKAVKGLIQGQQQSRPVDAQHPEAPPQRRGPRIGTDQHLLSMLNLNEDQKAKIKIIRDREAVDTKPLQEQLKNMQESLICLAEGANFDENAVRGLVNQESQLLAELNLIRIRSQNLVFNLLTTDQKNRLAEYRKNMKMEPPPPPKPPAPPKPPSE
ncbi:MAG: Spy/CpxP family protein refolding chaperone [Acidobacteria bacterium]|nr:Spy/CpxP family protein refolding chaperone [Acidobacteriota bacterium]